MNLTSRLLVCLFLLPLSVVCQERITRIMAGPLDDSHSRIVVAFMGVTGDSSKLQSLIVTTNRAKNKNDLPTEYLVDLTTTTRSLASGAKKQKILVFSWDKSGEREVKCGGGKWTKQSASPEIDNIVEVVKAVVSKSPRDVKEATEFTLPQDLEQKLISILEGLETSNLQCVRTGS